MFPASLFPAPPQAHLDFWDPNLALNLTLSITQGSVMLEGSSGVMFPVAHTQTYSQNTSKKHPLTILNAKRMTTSSFRLSCSPLKQRSRAIAKIAVKVSSRNLKKCQASVRKTKDVVDKKKAGPCEGSLFLRSGKVREEGRGAPLASATPRSLPATHLYLFFQLSSGFQKLGSQPDEEKIEEE